MDWGNVRGIGAMVVGLLLTVAAVLALTVRGLGKSLLIGFLVALISTSLAALGGAAAAYLRGWFERAMLSLHTREPK